MSGTDDLTAFFRRTPVALYRTAPDGQVLAANEALAKLLGYESVDALRQGLPSVASVYVEPAKREEWLQVVCDAGIVYDFDVQLARPDGSTIWVQDTARAVRDDSGRVLYFEGALIDVSEKVAARKARDMFIATVSHELRNPIAAMLGLGEELSKGYETFSDQERREIAHLIARQAEDASWLIEDLLVAHREDTSRIVLSPEDFDLTKEVERILEVVDAPVTVEVDGGDPIVSADPRRVRQIIRNLVDNAMRYGGDDIKVRIETGSNEVTLEVCDSGAPIPPDEAANIFEAFRTRDDTSHPKSVGLGLSVAQKLARMMGGDLGYEHRSGYSRFVVTLPAAS
ncbi:MAG: PAS domain-containing sensor histidine kinase [Actinobacteria bacterium]|nr:PAS domain-containing sensor histidine kinase [Actinomycetota bacterium]